MGTGVSAHEGALYDMDLDDDELGEPQLYVARGSKVVESSISNNNNKNLKKEMFGTFGGESESSPMKP